jgi:hypothetical protein
LLSGKEVRPVDALTDSGAGSAAAMANPSGGNAKAGLALRELVNVAPKAGTNTFIVTHKTNIADAFGKEGKRCAGGRSIHLPIRRIGCFGICHPREGSFLDRPGC